MKTIDQKFKQRDRIREQVFGQPTITQEEMKRHGKGLGTQNRPGQYGKGFMGHRRAQRDICFFSGSYLRDSLAGSSRFQGRLQPQLDAQSPRGWPVSFGKACSLKNPPGNRRRGITLSEQIRGWIGLDDRNQYRHLPDAAPLDSADKKELFYWQEASECVTL